MDNFKDKKVLLVCAETFSWPMHYVAEELRTVCSELNAVFIQPGEGYWNAPDFKLFKSLNDDINIYELSSVFKKYVEQHNDISLYLDREYIEYIEDNYTAYSGLNEQFLAEMMLLPYYHDRTYYEYIDYDKILLFAQLYYKYMEKLFSDNPPDIIVDCDVDFFGRSVLLELATYHDIPYISFDHARVSSYILPTTNLVKSHNILLRKSFNDYLNDSSQIDDKIQNMFHKVQGQLEDIPEMYKKMQSEQKFSSIKLIKRFIYLNLRFVKYFSIKKVILNKIDKVSSPLISDSFKSIWFWWKYIFRRFYLEYSSLLEKRDISKIKYIYVPLHVIPESTTTVVAPYYINELFNIESLSKSIAANQYIVVKEHWSMIGLRPLSFYKKLKKLPNVILIDPTYYSYPKDYIKNADLVVTISGSTALEAAFMGKNSLIFGDVLFGALSCIKKINVTDDLRKILKEHINYKMDCKELYAYLQLIQNFGEELNIKEFLMPPNRVDKAYVKNNITKLINIFNNGIELYKGKLDNEI